MTTSFPILEKNKKLYCHGTLTQAEYKRQKIKTVSCACGCGTPIAISRGRLTPSKIKVRGDKFYVNAHRLRGRKRPKYVGDKIRLTRLGRNNGLVGAGHGMWGDGTYRSVHGYIFRWVAPNNHQLAHRVVMEQILGRKLSRREVVHHINGNKTDNRPENLQVMTLSEHTRHHMLERHRYSSHV